MGFNVVVLSVTLAVAFSLSKVLRMMGVVTGFVVFSCRMMPLLSQSHLSLFKARVTLPLHRGGFLGPLREAQPVRATVKITKKVIFRFIF